MKRIPTFLLSSLISLSLWGQQLEQSSPAAVNMSQERLDRVDRYLSSSVENQLIPGGVFLLARQGKIVYHKSFGNRTQTEPYNSTDIFRIASMTKAVTSVAIMQLYEKGLLSLEDPVWWYLPAFENMTILDTFNEEDSSYITKPATKPITIRHLLTHTSGITYGDFNPGMIMAVYGEYQMLRVGLSHTSWSNEEFIDRLAQVPLVFEPGERFLYGLNMDVLGRVVEVISGKSLNDYFKEYIFTPLGMNDTYFYLPKEKHDRLVPVYQLSEEQTYSVVADDNLVGYIDYPVRKDNHHYAGGGGLSSTALDYAKFIQMLLNYGLYQGVRLLNPQTIDLIKADQMVALNREGKGYSNVPGVTFGLGFSVYTQDAEGFTIKSPGTYQWGGYFNTKYYIDPEEELIFVGMTQISGFQKGYFWDRLEAIMYGALED